MVLVDLTRVLCGIACISRTAPRLHRLLSCSYWLYLKSQRACTLDIMQSSTGLGAARSTGLACCPRLLRPVCAHLKPRAVFQSFSATSALRQSTSSRRQRLCTITAAQDQPDREPSVDNGQIQSPTGSDLRPQVSESKISADVKEEPKLGLAGSIVMWGFLVVCVQCDAMCTN